MEDWAKALVWSTDPRRPAAALPLLLMAVAVAAGLVRSSYAPATAGELLSSFDRTWAAELCRSSGAKKCVLEAKVELRDGERFADSLPTALLIRGPAAWFADAAPARLVLMTNLEEPAVRALLARDAVARRPRFQEAVSGARLEPWTGADRPAPPRSKGPPLAQGKP